jgi:nucleotide-binding universal stress UspA family protein
MPRRRRNRVRDAAPASARVAPVLLASEGRPFSSEAVELAARHAEEAGRRVHVLSVARIWGTSLGVPMPGLLPTKREWDEQGAIVRGAVRELERRGLQVEGHVVGTRRAAGQIVRHATELGAQAIVMGADPPRNRLVADLMWSQEPYRVRRKARVPVHLAVGGGR